MDKKKKQKLSKSKQRITEQSQEMKIDKMIDKQIEKRESGIVKNKELKKFKIKNDYNNANTTLSRELLKLEEIGKELKSKPNAENKKKFDKQKLVVKQAKIRKTKQKKIIKTEIKEINRLNSHSKGDTKKASKKDIEIEVKDVNKIYTSKNFIFYALEDASLKIKKGTFNVILGPSGSGKTTLLNVISGLDRATTGEVIINDTNISALSTKQLTQFRRKQIGFVFQSYNLLSSLNVGDNIEVGRALQTNPKLRKNTMDLLRDMEMPASFKKKTYELSGGQQQRVSIARALSKSPSILIGDEPTGALDQKTSLKVFRLFQEINRIQKTTIIIVTHNHNVAKLADQVFYVKDGTIDKVVTQKPLDARKIKEI